MSVTLRYNGQPRPDGSRRPDLGGGREFFGAILAQGDEWPFSDEQAAQLLFMFNQGESKETGQPSPDDKYPVFETVSESQPVDTTADTTTEPAPPPTSPPAAIILEQPTTPEPADMTPEPAEITEAGNDAGEGA